MGQRTVVPNAETIERLRLAKGWRVEDLAKEAGCSIRTVINIENGSNVYIYTLNKIAVSLGVEASELLVGEKPPELKPKERVWEIKITLSTPYEDFDETSDLPKLLQAIAARIGSIEMEPRRVGPGSTQVVIEMTDEEATKFFEAYKKGEFKGLSVRKFEQSYLPEADISGEVGARLRKEAKEAMEQLKQKNINKDLNKRETQDT